MSNVNLPKQTTNPYKREKWGYYGELGEGANAKIRFLQTVISHDELNDITLISNIPGSEKWDVRDLFQRDVDEKRVGNEIMPYLKDNSKVKFFNPLTLIVLPMADDGRNILNNVDHIEPKTKFEEDQEFDVYEKKGYYKFSIVKENQVFAKIEWNESKCYIVAIDGQHRLSALKRWKKQPGATNELDSWKIPVVLLNIFKVDENVESGNLLEIVRKTFVYINTQAVQVNDARKILLNDESINAIGTQELIQLSHNNDCKDVGERDESIIPLMFFDWRGETQMGRPVATPSSIKNTLEIYQWFEHYLLGEDGSECQEIELNLTDLYPPLQCINQSIPITHEDALRIRNQFHKTLLPGFLHFLQNFEPYREYIKSCREIEKEALERSDVAQHAFIKLRFGTHDAAEDQLEAVLEEYEKICFKFEALKNVIPDTIIRDIGMRGVVYAFGEGKVQYDILFDEPISWLDYSKWIITEINEIYIDGWFSSFDKLDAKKRKFLNNVIFDNSGTIINYRIEKAEDALGALLMILFFHKKWEKGQIDDEDISNIWISYSDKLKKVIDLGFRKTIKADLKDTFEGLQTDFNKEVRRLAAKATKKRLKELSKFLKIEGD
jgi:DNA-sulfur modification-associated